MRGAPGGEQHESPRESGSGHRRRARHRKSRGGRSPGEWGEGFALSDFLLFKMDIFNADLANELLGKLVQKTCVFGAIFSPFHHTSFCSFN